jgi:hypothetical protein
MTIKANGRSALILATGLFVCFAAGPSQAAADAENATASSENAAGTPVTPNQNAKHGSRHSKTHAHHKSNAADKVSTDKKADGAGDAGDNSFPPSTMTPSVANANAQLASADTPTSKAAKAMSARANEILQAAADNPADAQPAAADTQVVSADQVNDVDRALQESKPPAPMMAMASAEAPAAPVAPVAPVMAASNGESSTWERTSLIGKIFIGFGALLTMASAARMFMA